MEQPFALPQGCLGALTVCDFDLEFLHRPCEGFGEHPQVFPVDLRGYRKGSRGTGPGEYLLNRAKDRFRLHCFGEEPTILGPVVHHVDGRHDHPPLPGIKARVIAVERDRPESIDRLDVGVR